jgi:hypothetical protein
MSRCLFIRFNAVTASDIFSPNDLPSETFTVA